MKITAIEIDGARYEPQESHRIIACDECDLSDVCENVGFNKVCFYTRTEKRIKDCYKRVKE